MSTTDTPQAIAPMELRPAMTVAEVARAASLSRNYLYVLIRAGRLPVVRHGRAIRVRPEDFERWMQPSAR